MVVNTYEADLLAWRQMLDDRLRAEDGWLTLAGLHWLHQGENTLGSASDADILLPDSAPPRLGSLHFDGAQVVLRTDMPVLVDGVETQRAVLREDMAGASLVKSGAVTFFVIKRAGQYGVRVRDADSPARQTFTGRQWYPVNPDSVISATYIPHPEPRTMDVLNSVEQIVAIENPGVVQFELDGQTLQLEAFDNGDQGLWFLFKDATNGKTTYGSGRFLSAEYPEDGIVLLDFNRAYNPPCAFTPYATCPLAPKQNTLTVNIEAGEKYHL
jgi:uncharacterized protein